MKTVVQLMKFGIVGLLNTIVHYAVFELLFRVGGVDLLVSSAVGYAAGTVNSFLWNRKWTFQKQGASSKSEFLKFVVVNSVAVAGNLLCLRALVEGFGLVPELAQAIALGASMIVNFAGNKWWTFRSSAAEARVRSSGEMSTERGSHAER